jgi:Domain of unknown function (DUF4476)
MKLRRLALLALAACACHEVKPTPPPEPQVQPAPPQVTPAPAPPPVVRPPPEPPPQIIVEDGMRLEYRPRQGRTVVEITEPEGAQVQAYDGPALVASDTVPLAFDAEPDHYYRLVMTLPGGAAREKKVQARAGMMLSIRVLPAKGPQAMNEKEFRALRTAIDREPGDQGKLGVLRTAATAAYFTTAQAGTLLDHLVYREDKLAAIPVLKDRILDKENAWQLYQHFTYREDKVKVQEMLEH